MAARRQVTNKLRTVYQAGSKRERGEILDRVVATTGVGRSTARRLLTGPRLPTPTEQIDRRRVKPRHYSDAARVLLEHVWMLMGMPCGKYLVVMWPIWQPLLAAAGDLTLDGETIAEETVGEIGSMSPATVDRYLAPARNRMRLKGISTTKPAAPALRNSIVIRTVADDRDTLPGAIEADTVAHCGPTLRGEFARTLTMTDMVSGWTENVSVRNNAKTWITRAVDDLTARFPFPVRTFDSDNGSEFINHQVAVWLQDRDIAQTRSRPYHKNDQATVESKNNHVVRRYGFHWRYDTTAEIDLLNSLWPLVSVKLNFFTPTKKPVEYTTTADGRRRRRYDQPTTPWQRVCESEVLTDGQVRTIEARIAGINPADLTRQITHIQDRLIELAAGKTQALLKNQGLDLDSLQPSINRLTANHGKPARAQSM